MPIRAQDVLSISEAPTRLAELAEDVVAGAEKILTKDGAPYVAIIEVSPSLKPYASVLEGITL